MSKYLTDENITQYISECNALYKAGNATEHSYRPALQRLLENIVETHCKASLQIVNEPQRIDCGAPDYVLTDKNIPFAYIEAKDINCNLNDKKYKNQFDRYKKSLDNLIITDYLLFQLYNNGELVVETRIGNTENNKITPVADNFSKLQELISLFLNANSQTIKTSAELSKQMAAKARLLAEIIENSLNKDIENKEDTELINQYEGFKSILIDTISTKDFADLYAQTIAYGMFAARINYVPQFPSFGGVPEGRGGKFNEKPPTATSTTPAPPKEGNLATPASSREGYLTTPNPSKGGEFTRELAAKSIPQTNPFLRKMFGFIAGVDLDSRISWIVDALADLFNYVDINKIHKEIGRYADNDPIIHFYETFLTDYDKRLKKQRGVWYTPQPVVRFIVSAVNEILKTDFGIANGLADNSFTSSHLPPKEGETPLSFGEGQGERFHRVQILDPATGTGTFLAEIVEQIHSNFTSKGVWENYVNEHLIPRLNGFEILMASYAMAHLKLEMLLQETKAEITNNQRIRIYLTDSLDEENDKNKAKQKKTSILKWLTDEANEAADIKRKNPVMVILGNPPYSGESQNKGEWIMDLMEDYKKEPTGGRLQEKNSKWLNDDYAKFIRLGQHFVEKNGFGILAYINNHSFLDNPTFRGMRYNLLKTFDKIYIIDLHGNAKKKEAAPDGGKDENVFDIQQGVSINIFIKTPNTKTQTAQIFHYDLYGKREEKYSYLLENNLQTVKWTELQPAAPNYFFVQKDFSLLSEYEKGFKITDLFTLNSVGIVTANDSVFVNTDKNQLISNIKNKFNILPDNSLIQKIDYRPFDTQFIYYDSKKIERARENVMKHFIIDKNVGLMICRQQKTGGFYHCFFHKNIVESSFVSNKTSEIGYSFPLYLYRDNFGKTEKVVNLNETIIKEISERTGLRFTEEPNSPPLEGCPKGGVVSSMMEKYLLPAPKKNHPLPPPKEGNLGVFPKEGNLGEFTQPPLPLQGRGIEGDLVTPVTHLRNTQNYMALPYNPKLRERARELRKAGNLSEVLFWNQVKNKQFKNFDFDRQKIIGNYIVDFYCANCNVVIEIDGSSHEDKQEYDAIRDEYLKNLGLEVIHIADIDVKKNLRAVMDMLYNHPAFDATQFPTFEAAGAIDGHQHNSPPLETLLNSPPLEISPINILDYIYAVLHSASYREKYKEFLKIDFPRIPYPENAEEFEKMAGFGEKLRKLHLMENVEIDNFIANFPEIGSNEIEKPSLTPSPSPKERGDSPPSEGRQPQADGVVNSPPLAGAGGGKVYINDTQYFDNVPISAWNFYIGGYQPAQKWLKDRKGVTLNYDDIVHYQKMIYVLMETEKVMSKIDRE